jgi:hypothetical protein
MSTTEIDPAELALRLQRKTNNACSLLNGCALEYGGALKSNRLDAWAKMVHAMVDVLATGNVEDQWP